MKRLIAAGIATGALLIVVGCSGGGYGTVTGQVDTTTFAQAGGPTPPPPPTASTALFNLSTGQLPYPTDLYFAGSKDGALNIQPPNAVWPNQKFLNSLDGFSTNAVIREQFGGALDPTSLTASSLIIVPVVTDNLTKATTGFLGGMPHPLHPGTDYTAALATDGGVGPQILEITPLHPLLPSTCISNGQFLGANCKTGTGYLVILTNGIKDAAGAAAVPDTDYAAIKSALQGGPTCPSITDKTLNGVCRLTGAHLQLAQALGLNPANIVLTFSFTTEGTVDTLELMSATASTTGQTIKVNPTGLNTSNIPGLGLPGHADIYLGALSIPYYLGTPAQGPTAPVTAWWQAPPFPLDPASTKVTRFNPLPVPTAAHLLIPLLVTVPNAKSALGATPPASGWPVLIFQHGITRSREDMFGVADSFADAGFVVVAIDLPLHGVTNPKDPLYATDANPAYTGIIPKGTGSIERTFDLELITPGTIDPSGSHAINLTSPLTSRDGLREGAVDLVMFSRLLPQLSLGPAGTIDATRIHYLGHSLGAIEGTVFMALAGPAVGTATLANPGGRIPGILTESPSFAPKVNAGLEAQGLIPGTTLYANFWRDIQTLWDAGDPVNYVALATATHPIHMLQVVGASPPPAGCTPNVPPPVNCPDQVVTNTSTQALITASAYLPTGAAGAPLTRIPAPAAPGPVPITGPVYVNFIEGDHGSIIDGKVLPVTIEMQGEAITFAGGPLPPAPAIGFPGFPATPPGTTIFVGNPSVIQGP
jgi:pimeloyl-ACP methyl ester carboxylesterase